MRLARAVLLAASLLVAHSLAAQAVPAATAPAPPATKLEGFKPSAGSIVTFGYDDLAGKLAGVALDVREIRSATGGLVRGVVVEVTESQYRAERSFIDADEIPELLRGVVALRAVKSNPTAFTNFEVRYRTRGELELTAYNRGPTIAFALSVGRTLRATRRNFDLGDLWELQTLLEAAQQKLATLPPP